ncbi:MAG: hypothetical protein ACP5PN_07905 [Steroidobacteraceae bacterium]
MTHESDIAAYADRVITMRDGQIISDERRASKAQAAPQAPQPTIQPQPARAHTLPFTRMIVSSAFQAIGRNEMRSGLTTLGVLIGVAALIAMVAVGQGPTGLSGSSFRTSGPI